VPDNATLNAIRIAENNALESIRRHCKWITREREAAAILFDIQPSFSWNPLRWQIYILHVPNPVSIAQAVIVGVPEQGFGTAWFE
jgi:hypothetical protein